MAAGPNTGVAFARGDWSDAVAEAFGNYFGYQIDCAPLAHRRKKGYNMRSFAKRRKMKSDIHPKYEEATITCACGNVMKTRSTRKEMSVNTCSACHPYFTGAKTLVDTEGRVDSFRKRYAKFAK